MKDSFIFYRSFYESIKYLDKDIQIELYNAICEYSFNDKLSELSPVAQALFTMIKVNIDNAMKRYNASVENGKKGGRPKKNKPNENLKKPNNNLNETQDKPNDNLNYNYNDNYNDNDNYNINYNENENENINNSNLNILSSLPKEEEVLKEEFEKLWKLYPKKVGKEKSFTKYKKYRTSKGDDYCTYEEVLNGLERYLKYIKQNSWYSPKDGSTWFNNRGWNDEYELAEDNIPIWFNKEIESEPISEQEEDEMQKLIDDIVER